MAVDLVLRLCQEVPAQGEPGYTSSMAPIALNDFTDALFSVLHGAHDVMNVKTFYDMPSTPGTPQTDQQGSFDTLWALINNKANLALKLLAVHRFRAILDFYERKDDLNLTAYDTPNDIQTWLLAI